MSAQVPAGGRESPRFALVVLGLAVLVAIVNLRFHTAWRDELQAWALVRASPSFAELWKNLQPEAHPLLWYLVIGGIQQVTLHTSALAIVHSAFACAAIWLLARYAPFPPAVRALIALSHFVLVEYFAVVRGYVLVELLTFACCAELMGKRRPWLLALLLALLAQTELYGAMIGAGLCAAWILLERKTPDTARPSRARAGLFAALLLYAVSAAFCVYQLLRRLEIPLAPAGLFTPIPYSHPLARMLAEIVEVLVPILGHRGLPEWFLIHPAISCALATALLGAMSWSLLFSPSGLACWSLAAIPMLVFGQTAAVPARHHGMLFLAFVAAWWLAASERPEPASRTNRWRFLFVTLFFAQLAPFGLFDFVHELQPRSAAPEAARYLEREGLVDLPMLCDEDSKAVSVLAVIDRPCYFPSIGAESRFAKWGANRIAVGQPELASATAQLLQESPVVLLLLNHPLASPLAGVSALASFEQSTNPTERFYLYRATRPAPLP